MPRHKDIIVGKWMPNGDIRFFRNDNRKSGVPELVTVYFRNVMAAIICGNINHVIIEYDFSDNDIRCTVGV